MDYIIPKIDKGKHQSSFQINVTIACFDSILGIVEERSPLKRNIAHQDVGDLALFLSSDLARSITGQVIYVDSGFSTVVL